MSTAATRIFRLAVLPGESEMWAPVRAYADLVLSIRPSAASRRAAAFVASAALVVSLSACGGDEDDPLDGVAAPAGPDASASPTPTLAAASGDATKKTDEGAKAFAEYYFETVVNEARTQGRLDKLVEVSDANCVVCLATVGEIAYFTLARQAAQGGKVSVSGLKVTNSTAEVTTVELTYATEKLTYKNLDGSTAYSVKARDNVGFYVQMQWDPTIEGWKVRQIVDKKTIDGTG